MCSITSLASSTETGEYKLHRTTVIVHLPYSEIFSATTKGTLHKLNQMLVKCRRVARDPNPL